MLVLVAVHRSSTVEVASGFTSRNGTITSMRRTGVRRKMPSLLSEARGVADGQAAG
jgi:hypothetical protein